MNANNIRTVMCRSGGVAAYLTFILIISSALASQEQSASSVYTNLESYLTNRSWVTEMTIEFSMNRYSPKRAPQTQEAFSIWKSSLQPGGFYIQCISNTPYASGSILMFGESATEYWQTSNLSYDDSSLNGVATAWKDPTKGGSNSNGRRIMCLYFKQVIASVLNCGIQGLDNKNIRWISTREFDSPLLDWIGNPTTGHIDVTIEQSQEGLPLRMKCVTTTATNTVECIILCSYDGYSLPPQHVIVQTLAGGRVVKSLTNIIDNINFGERPDAALGFSLSDFIPKDVVPKHTIMESNGVRYAATSNGAFVRIPEILDGDLRIPSSRASWLARWLLISISLLSFAAIIVTAFRHSSESKQ